MTAPRLTLTQRLGSYGSVLDEAIEARTTTVHDRAVPRVADDVDVGEIEVARPDGGHGSGWSYVGWAAAVAVVVAGVALGLLTTGTGSEVASAGGDWRADEPAVCSGVGDAAELGAPAVDTDLYNPGFLIALPAETLPKTLAIRAVINPRAGIDCLAYDPDETSMSIDQDDSVVAVVTSLGPNNRRTRFELSIATFEDSIGVTALVGATDFATIQSGDSLVLEIGTGLPHDAVSIEVDTRSGEQWKTVEQRISGPTSIPLDLVSNGDNQIHASPIDAVVFRVLDAKGNVIDIGGTLV